MMPQLQHRHSTQSVFRQLLEVLNDARGEHLHLHEVMRATGLPRGAIETGLRDVVAAAYVEHDATTRTWWWSPHEWRRSASTPGLCATRIEGIRR